MKRFFAFGCSFTKHHWPTWADFIAVNYDQYYNLGTGGASNTFIMNRFIEIDALLNFNSQTDLVIIMLTGFNRFSWLDKSFFWRNVGDLHSWKVCKHREKNYETHELALLNFYDKMYNKEWAVYQNWIAVQTIKTILVSKQINHKILAGMNFFDELESKSSPPVNKKLQGIFKILDVPETLMNYKLNSKDINVKFKNGELDGHPSFSTHFDYTLKYLPELVTKKTCQLHTALLDNIKYESKKNDYVISENIKKVFINDLTDKLDRYGG